MRLDGARCRAGVHTFRMEFKASKSAEDLSLFGDADLLSSRTKARNSAHSHVVSSCCCQLQHSMSQFSVLGKGVQHLLHHSGSLALHS